MTDKPDTGTPDVIREGDKKRIMFVATTPFAVNAFLAPHLKSLSKWFRISLCVNVNAYPLSPEIQQFVEVIDIGLERKIAPLKDLIALVRLILVVRRCEPLAIHSIMPKAGILAMFAGFLARVPNRWHTFTGQVWSNKRGIVRRLLKAIDQLIVVFSTRVFADSASQCRFLREEKVVTVGGISILGPGSIAGVDTEKFTPDVLVRKAIRQKVGALEQGCVFLFVGRLARDKGIFDLLSAFGKIAEDAPNIELWMVGPDEEALSPQLKKIGESIAASIRWIGATEVPEKYMMAADVLVLPSYREGFGSVLIEAGSCGLPVVAYKVDGVIDAVEDGASGLLVELGRTEILAEKMRMLAFDELKRISLGGKARQRVLNTFRVEAVSDAWLKHYRRSLLGAAE